MAAVVTRIDPARGREGDPLTISGSGFAADGANRVTLNGSVVGNTTVDQETIQVIAPVGLPNDRHVEVTVENLNDSTQALWWWWSKPTLATLALSSYRIPMKDRGIESVPGPAVVDSIDFEHGADKAEQIVHDQVTVKGTLLGFISAGLRGVVVGGDGSRPVRDTAKGLLYRNRDPACLWYGYQTLIGSTGEVRFSANADDTIATPVGVNQPALATGKIALLSVHVRESEPFNFFGLVRFVLYVNDVAVWDTLTDIDIAGSPNVKTGQVWTAAPWLDVTTGDRIGLGAYRGGSTWDNIRARALVVVV